MATIFKTDLDTLAAAYLKNSVNSAINPFHQAYMPAYADVNLVSAFNYDPPESRPSGTLYGAITVNSVRNAMIFLGTYYGYIARGHYGLWTSNNAPGYWANEGYGYFMFKDTTPGVQDHLTRVVNALQATGVTSGNITQARIIQLYQLAWTAINTRKDDMTAELGVCHNSCHNNCHNSRGRR